MSPRSGSAPSPPDRVRPHLRAAGRMARRPGAALRMARALAIGAAPQFGRQVTQLTDEAFARDLVSSLLAGAGVVEVAFARDGMVWRSDLGDEVGRTLFRTGAYEAEEITAVLRWLERHGRTGTVIDVGANIGTTTIPFARAGFPVVAVEPVSPTYDLLTANVAASGHAGSITTIRQAIAAEPGSIPMWVGFGSGRSEVAVGHEPPDMKAQGTPTTESVPAGPLHQVLHDTGTRVEDVALVWADVQGCETDVIATAPALWAAGVPLWLEVDPERLDRQAGLSRFVAAVTEGFSAFAPRETVLAGGDGLPITSFAAWVGDIPPGRYDDAMLMSRPSS